MNARPHALALLLLAAAACGVHAASPPTPIDAAGWTTLIEGADGLQNFTPVGVADWSAVDGAIQAGKGTGEPGYLVSRSSYANFQLRAEFWVSPDADSGIFLRCAEPTNISSVSCYQVNIFDQCPDPRFGTGSIVYVATVQSVPKTGGTWNTIEITARGSHLTVAINGSQTVDVRDDRLKAGPIALQWAIGTIKFRKLQVRAL